MLNLFWPKFTVICIILAYALVRGYYYSKRTAFHPTLGDILRGSVKASPFLLSLGIGFVVIL